MNTNLSALQNGSDIRGVALAVPGGAPVSLTADIANRIAIAFVQYVAKKAGKNCESLKIGVGHDSRVTATALKEAILSGILAAGAQAFDCAMASTPAMFCATVYSETDFDGSVMITASHLPMERNGMKLFDRDGGFDKPDIKAVLKAAEQIIEQHSDKQAQPLDLISLYSADLCQKIKRGVAAADYDHPLAGLHVVLDAGNGAGGFFAEKVLLPLGADISGSQFLEPDGTFPNHMPNPENKAAMASVRAATVKNNADLGIIFDTDVDRMSAVLPNGEEVNRDAIIAMMAAVLAPDYPGATVVTDSVTSDRLTTFLESELGMRHHRFKRGYKNVINEAIRLNKEGVVCPLAIETSGHGALSENYFLDDGAYMAVKLLVAAARAKNQGKRLGALIETLPAAFEEKEVRIPIAGADFAKTGETVLKVFEERAREAGYTVAPNSYEGIRLTFPEGWALLRLSLHDPLLPLNVEGNAEGDCQTLLRRVAGLLQSFDALDLSVLEK
ncbi:phosphomannomutase/phosphoglucomutase [Oscillospiraceae bacterium LTW-04]|nr:phosphomannomutase/phosphoglucomutase [Oscillospiraceae bacterium MB24-C1]